MIEWGLSESVCDQRNGFHFVVLFLFVFNIAQPYQAEEKSEKRMNESMMENVLVRAKPL